MRVMPETSADDQAVVQGKKKQRQVGGGSQHKDSPQGLGAKASPEASGSSLILTPCPKPSGQASETCWGSRERGLHERTQKSWPTHP